MQRNSLLRLTEEDHDPVLDMRAAASAAVFAARRILRRALDTSPLGRVAHRVLFPRLRVASKGRELVITIDLAGCDKGSVEVVLDSRNVLHVLGTSRAVTRRPHGIRTAERPRLPRAPRLPFERTFVIREAIERSQAVALLDGYRLIVTVPRKVVADVESKPDSSGVIAAA